MKSTILTLSISMIAACGAHAALLSINSIGQDSVSWSTGTASFLNAQFSIEGSGSTFSNSSFTIFYFPDDRPEQGLRTFAALLPSEVDLTSSFYREGATVDLTSATYGNQIWVLDTNQLQNNAVNGSDNFVGIRKMDSLGAYHYGWMQFELNQFSNGQIAFDFLGASIESTANTSFTAGSASSVPEPASLFLGLMGSICVLRRRRI